MPEVQEFINVILSVHEKYKKIVQTVFAGHKSFMGALDDVNSISNHFKYSAWFYYLTYRGVKALLTTFIPTRLMPNHQD